MAMAAISASPAAAMAMKPLRLSTTTTAWTSADYKLTPTTTATRLPASFHIRRGSCPVSAAPSSGGLPSTSDHGVAPAKEASPTPAPDSVATTPFHLAIPVHDIHAARGFFGGVLGCPEGRSAKTWVDFNLFGHQVVCHEVRNYNASSSANAVDGDPVPVPHFGLAMSVPEFHAMAERVRAAGIEFVIEPHIRFVGQPGEQWTMFFKDGSGNALEFKAMTTPSNLFAKYVVE